MTTKVWSKKFTQEMIKLLRSRNIIINKIDGGYTSDEEKFGRPIFKAMNGTNGYLVIHANDLFRQQEA